jgi:hypothetical protein
MITIQTNEPKQRQTGLRPSAPKKSSKFKTQSEHDQIYERPVPD